MSKTLGISTAILLLTAAFAVPEPAAADRGWSFGSKFRIGDVHFSLGFHEHRPHQYFWRTRIDVGRTYYGRAHRSSGCEVRNGYHYHGRHCPLIHGYFQSHDYDVDLVFDRYAPGRHRYGSSGRYNSYNYDRYDYRRYDRRGYDRRNYRRDGPSCPY